MARGGGAGGGRSSGGGGNRSFGGRSGGGGSNRSGVNRGGSSGGFKGGTPNRGMGHSHGHGHGMGRMYPPPPPRRSRGFFRRPYYGGGGNNGCGCLTISIIVIIAVVVGALLLSFMSSGSSYNVTASTIEREPLPAGSVNETGYYTDELGWIGNSTTLTSGMKTFYKETGVQPYLYITDTIDGNHTPTSAQVEQFAYDTYDSLFTDEAHVLVIFFEYEKDDSYFTYYLAGVQTKTVLDDEAMNILLDYIDKYYYDSNLTDEQFFSQAFNDAGTRIMKVTTSPWIPVLIVLGILAIIVVIFIWWKNYKKQKNLEAEQTEKILNTPLESFGDSEAEDRAKKYDD